MQNTSTIAFLIAALGNLYSGYSFEEIGEGFREVWQTLLNRYEPVNPLEYE